jgi:hypothetical protein
MTELTDADRKVLMEFLGECDHKWKFTRLSSIDGKSTCQICGKEVWDGEKIVNRRTFTTPDDMMALKDKLVQKGMWCEFYFFCNERWESPMDVDDDTRWGDPSFTNWLFAPPRFCWLVGEWLKVK